ncbi:MAG: hypothetical protein H7240_05155 [Glaciimonas sp.]|nr:hypothetical protein [Glaciimonas sp.]
MLPSVWWAAMQRYTSEAIKVSVCFTLSLAPAIARIHQHLKTTFDPAGIFNPGPMYPAM